MPHVHVLKSHFSSIQNNCERLPDKVCLGSFLVFVLLGPLIIKHHTVLLQLDIKSSLLSEKGVTLQKPPADQETFLPTILYLIWGINALDIHLQYHSKFAKT
jgi:hypothetical protein